MPTSFQQPLLAEQAAAAGSSITIEELEVTSPGGQLRKLLLLGGGLPLMEQADWSGDSRIVTTWYPGNGTEASQQILGPQELPSAWAGEWNRTRLGRQPCLYWNEVGARSLVIDPKLLWDVMDDFRIAAPLLRVTWAVRGREIDNRGQLSPVDFQVVRVGRLKMVKVTPQRHTDMKWTAEFHWTSRGKQQAKVASTRRDEDLALAAQAVQASLAALEGIVNSKIVSINKNLKNSASNLTLGQLESMAGAPLLALNRSMAKLRYNGGQFARIGQLARTLSTTPISVANAVIDYSRNTMQAANGFCQQVDRIPMELKSKSRKVSDMARAEVYIGRTQDGMEAVARASAALDLRLRQALVSGANRGQVTVRESSTTRQGDMIAIHVAKTGETPSTVSNRYYGTPDQADAIMYANRLPLHQPTFRTGQIVVIPALVNAPRGG